MMNGEMFGTLPDGKGQAATLNIFPAYLRDIDADLYIRNIMITYGDEDYPYTPAPEIDETVVI